MIVMNKLFFVFVFLLVVCSVSGQNSEVWDGTVAGAFAGGDGTEDNPYQIANAAQLAKLAQDVNNGNEYKDEYFVQTVDIDLGGENKVQWIPIGNLYGRFAGTYNGSFKKIHNLYINNPDDIGTLYLGLFGMISESANVKNVIVDGEIISGPYSGGVVGICEGNVDGCFSMVRLTSLGNIAGGVVGNLYSTGTVSNSVFLGEIYGGLSVGGIVGDSRGNVKNVINLGHIVASAERIQPLLGGIVGVNIGIIEGAINAGCIEAEYDKKGSPGYTGGIIGLENENGKISDCLNVGIVAGVKNVGSVLGMGDGTTISNVYYDSQLALGLLPGDAFAGNNVVKGEFTKELISGKADVIDFNATDNWIFNKGAYPQLRAFAESDVLLFRQLSALAAVPVDVENYEVLGAMRSGFIVPERIVSGDDEFWLEWSSETEELSFEGNECSFIPPAEDKKLRFHVNIAGTEFCKYFISPYYSMFREVETPVYREEGGKKIYEISTFGHFVWVNGIVNGLILVDADRNAMPEYTSFSNCYVEMKNDVDFSGYSWLPVAGCGADLRYFAGHFNGNGFSVKNLTINKPGEIKAALFGFVAGEGSCIENLVLDGGSIYASEYVAGIVANLAYSRVENCYNKSCNIEGDFCVGGIAGLLFGSEINSCYNSASVMTDDNLLGGVVAAMTDDINFPSLCRLSFNSGDLYSTGGNIGGLVGMLGEFSLVEDCFNIGNIGADNDIMGGIVGYSEFGEVNNCYNAGKITKPIGFIGKMNVGEILGFSSGTSLSNNYYDVDVSDIDAGVAEENVEGVDGLTTDEMKNNDSFVSMLGDDIWTLDIDGTNNGYPIFKWMKNSVSVTMSDKQKICLYPNPFDDFLSWDSELDVHVVEIYDMQGINVAKIETEDDNMIYVGELSGGTYIVRLQCSDNKYYDVKVLKND